MRMAEETRRFLLQRVSVLAHVVVVEEDDMLQRRRRTQVNVTVGSHRQTYATSLITVC